MKEVYDAGFRLHHFYEEGDKKQSYLSYCLRSNAKEILSTEYSTLSNECLLEEVDGKKNYELFLKEAKWVKQIVVNYGTGEYGFDVEDENLRKALMDHYQYSSDKETFEKLMTLLNVNREKPEVVEENK